MALVLPLAAASFPYIIEQSVLCLRGGGVLAIPTDSFYALAVSAFQSEALEKLQAIKGDRGHKPFPVLIGDLSQLDQLVDDVPEIAEKLIQRFWPGLLTLTLRAKPQLSARVVSAEGTIGVRQPNDVRICELINQTGPLTGTSANRSGQLPLRFAQEVEQQIGAGIDLILDGGQTPGGQPSTVLQVEPQVRIIRQGAILLEAIQKFSEEATLSD